MATAQLSIIIVTAKTLTALVLGLEFQSWRGPSWLDLYHFRWRQSMKLFKTWQKEMAVMCTYLGVVGKNSLKFKSMLMLGIEFLSVFRVSQRNKFIMEVIEWYSLTPEKWLFWTVVKMCFFERDQVCSVVWLWFIFNNDPQLSLFKKNFLNIYIYISIHIYCECELKICFQYIYIYIYCECELKICFQYIYVLF